MQQECDICNKQFKNKQGLNYHESHYVCRKFACPYCLQRFKCSAGLKYHTENRICLPAEKIVVNVIPRTSYHMYTLSRDDLKLRDVLDAVPNFGQILFESTALPREKYARVLTKFIELALINPKLDHYWSAYISNKREPFITVYNGEEWVIRPQQTEFPAMCNWAMTYVAKYLDDNKSFIRGRNQYWTTYYIIKDCLDKPGHEIHKIVKNTLICLFVNHKYKISQKMAETGLKLKPHRVTL